MNAGSKESVYLERSDLKESATELKEKGGVLTITTTKKATDDDSTRIRLVRTPRQLWDRSRFACDLLTALGLVERKRVETVALGDGGLPGLEGMSALAPVVCVFRASFSLASLASVQPLLSTTDGP